MTQQIIPVGGGLLSSDRLDAPLFRYILQQTGKTRPRVCYLPTASAERPEAVNRFYEGCLALGAFPSVLSLFRLPTSDLEGFLLSHNAIVVGGGNTRSMLALWKEWGLDQSLVKAGEAGIVLAGSSAGANCWFEQFTTDSVPGELRVMAGLGMLGGSFSPHFSEEPLRRPTFHRLLSAGEIASGLAADENVALHFIDGRLTRVVGSRAGARAYRVELRSGSVVEEAIPTDTLPSDG